MLDADVILFATEKPSDIPALEKIPTFNRLKAVAEHRAVFTDGVLTGAIYFMRPLSLPLRARPAHAAARGRRRRARHRAASSKRAS